MLRGTTTFTCDKCGHKFKGPDFEFHAMVWTTPQPCPKCGSYHTYPKQLFGLNKIWYTKIWEYMDKTGNSGDEQ